MVGVSQGVPPPPLPGTTFSSLNQETQNTPHRLPASSQPAGFQPGTGAKAQCWLPARGLGPGGLAWPALPWLSR